MSRSSRAAQRRKDAKHYKSRNGSERVFAIHESSHVIAAYACGTTIDLDEPFALTVTPDECGVWSRFKKLGPESSTTDFGVIASAGPIGERIFSTESFLKGAEDFSYSTDTVQIMYAGVCIKHPELNAKLCKASPEQRERIEDEYGREPLFRSMYILEHLDDLHADEFRKLFPICKDHYTAAQSLFYGPPKDAEESFQVVQDREAFELLRPMAARSWALVRQNWSSIECLADEIQRRKTMSGREVHEFVTQTLAVSA